MAILSSASCPAPRTSSIVAPRMGIRTRPFPAAQSMSNHAANGESIPSASTDQKARLWYSGVGIAMWLGTTSTMMPRPRAWAASASRSNAPRPPMTSLRCV